MTWVLSLLLKPKFFSSNATKTRPVITKPRVEIFSNLTDESNEPQQVPVQPVNKAILRETKITHRGKLLKVCFH